MRTIITMMIILFMTCVVAVSGHSKIRQKRDWILDSFTIEEESPGPFPYSLGIINVDRKYLVEFRLTGKGVTEKPKGVLSINKNTGEVLVHKKVDYERDTFLTLKFEAIDVASEKVDTRLAVEIKVQDINDHAPVFVPRNIETTLDESYPQGKSVTTVFASDGDDSSTPNGTFTFRLVSATPETDNVEFYIRQNDNIGNIYFKGCLNYEKAQKYTLQIEAKDHGDKVQLSSTSTVVLNIIDQNNHLPEITGHTGKGTIKERDSGVEVLRLNVNDKNSPGSPAWKAKFTLHGDKENYFKIQTDPKTNEGILTVVKAMDYEKQTSKNVSISVENEVPYFFCKVKKRPPQSLWDIETSAEGSSTGAPKRYPVTIFVEDINEPPEFVPPIQVTMIRENTKVGTSFYTLTAIDPDVSSGGLFHFVKGEDKDNWVTVDSKTGNVSVAKVMDRESPFVNNSGYSVIMYAVENAQPRLTGTGTLVIHLLDENDNVPLLEVNKTNVCLSDKETKTNITAVDLHLQPYSAPFHYELLGDVKGKWRIEPNSGTTVNLIREKNVYSGPYEFQVKISDSQGFGLVQNLSVTVCNCSITPSCNVRRYMTAGLSLTAIGIIIFALLLLLVSLLVAYLISCKEKKFIISIDEAADSYLLKYNTEAPGTDQKVPNKITQMGMSENSVKTYNSLGAQNGISTPESVLHKVQVSHQRFATSTEQKMSRRTLQRSSTRRSYQEIKQYDAMGTMSRKYSTYSSDVSLRHKLSFLLEQRLLQVETQEDLCDYEPHCYANEGESETDDDLDTSSILEIDFDPDILTNLDFRFKDLATVCRPDLS
ncbi:cadherin-like protein 26 isoform X1 [Neoarius graeffei]|uniref:cadherin-like protein 26 isoform X1 n=1 Tax=Neoarius graeffei TaxID=443677 RepID=UPI00298C16FD|nr:cadherin-like protein 26 isoform X1 [Neoarius graeffei]